MKRHVNDQMVAGYVDGSIDEATAFSVEAHLLACGPCRGMVTAHAGNGRLERIWGEVVEVLDAPRPRPVERLLTRLGVREHTARLLAATPSLRLSWFVANCVALGFAVLAAHQGGGDRGLLVFLAVAPLLPVAGVAAVYGPGIDPTHEIGMAAPMQGSRLLLIRATAVLVSSSVLAGAAASLLPNLGWTVATWILPALGLTLASLAATTTVRPLVAMGSVTFLWLAGLVAYALAPGPVSVHRILAFRPAGQIAFALLAAVAGLTVAVRRDRFNIAAAL